MRPETACHRACGGGCRGASGSASQREKHFRKAVQSAMHGSGAPILRDDPSAHAPQPEEENAGASPPGDADGAGGDACRKDCLRLPRLLPVPHAFHACQTPSPPACFTLSPSACVQPSARLRGLPAGYLLPVQAGRFHFLPAGRTTRLLHGMPAFRFSCTPAGRFRFRFLIRRMDC